MHLTAGFGNSFAHKFLRELNNDVKRNPGQNHVNDIPPTDNQSLGNNSTGGWSSRTGTPLYSPSTIPISSKFVANMSGRV